MRNLIRVMRRHDLTKKKTTKKTTTHTKTKTLREHLQGQRASPEAFETFNQGNDKDKCSDIPIKSEAGQRVLHKMW